MIIVKKLNMFVLQSVVQKAGTVLFSSSQMGLLIHLNRQFLHDKNFSCLNKAPKNKKNSDIEYHISETITAMVSKFPLSADVNVTVIILFYFRRLFVVHVPYFFRNQLKALDDSVQICEKHANIALIE